MGKNNSLVPAGNYDLTTLLGKGYLPEGAEVMYSENISVERAPQIAVTYAGISLRYSSHKTVTRTVIIKTPKER